MIGETQHTQIDALIWPLDVRIGDMLKTIAQIELLMIAKTHTESNMIAKLERTAKVTVRINKGRRNQMKTNRTFKIGAIAEGFFCCRRNTGVTEKSVTV